MTEQTQFKAELTNHVWTDKDSNMNSISNDKLYTVHTDKIVKASNMYVLFPDIPRSNWAASWITEVDNNDKPVGIQENYIFKR